MAEQEKTKNKYTEAIGRRKTSTARVRIIEASKANFVVNGKDAKEYFKTEDQRLPTASKYFSFVACFSILVFYF